MDIIRILFTFMTAYVAYLHTVQIEKKNKNNTLWRYGKRVYLLLAAIGILYLLIIFFDKTLQLRFFGYILSINFAVVSFFTIYTVSNLKLLLNRTFTKFVSVLTGAVPVLIGLTSYEYTLVFPESTSLIIIVNFIIFLGIIILNTIKKKSNLNSFQISVIKFVLPERILGEFVKFNEKIKLEIEALRILDRIPENKKLIIETYLLNKLTEKYSSPYSKVKTVLYSILTFLVLGIISAIIEFITQDTFYNPFLKEILCKYFNCK